MQLAWADLYTFTQRDNATPPRCDTTRNRCTLKLALKKTASAPGQPADFDPSPLLGVFEDTINRLHKLKVEVAREIVQLEVHVVSAYDTM